MKSLIILSAFLVAVSCQFGGYRGDPSLARIISDQRAHHIAGDFRVAVKQEDGTNIEEHAVAGGSRRGSYSYVNDQGRTETVKWEAGPGGFRVLNANNQPAHPQQTAAYKAAAANLAREHAAANARVAEAVRQAALNPTPVQHHVPVKQYQPTRPVHQVSYHHTPQQHHVPVPVQHYQPVQYQAPTTLRPVVPKRFFPPGQLSFSRNNKGYNYAFNS